MTDQQLHHIFNHIPAIGQAIGLCVLLVALLLKKQQAVTTAAWIIIVASLSFFVANQSGEGTEEKVEHLAGVSHDQIHEHEEMAERTMPFSLASGGLALVYLLALWRKWKFGNIISLLLLAATGVSIYMLILTSHEGGLIRHPELSDNAETQIQNGANNVEGENDDD